MIPQAFAYPNEHAHLWADVPMLLAVSAACWFWHPNRIAPEAPTIMNSHDSDVIIIGSGFGGSISANRLALAGLKVLVLERGPWRDSLPVRSMGIERRAPFPYGMKSVTHLLRTDSCRSLEADAQ